MKVRIPARAGLARFFLAPSGASLSSRRPCWSSPPSRVFCYSYQKYTSLVDQKLRGPFANTAKIFAAPESRCRRRPLLARDYRCRSAAQRIYRIALQSAGYFQRSPTPSISFPVPNPTSIRKRPPSSSRTAASRRSFRCRTTPRGPEYQLEPQLITNVAGPSREKRRTVKFHDIPNGSGASHNLRRGQALLPASRLRPRPRGESGLCRSETGQEEPGRIHAHHAACAHDAGRA